MSRLVLVTRILLDYQCLENDCRSISGHVEKESQNALLFSLQMVLFTSVTLNLNQLLWLYN
jgi:hypothetical protein